jgi:alpha-tubulin suppressor-like RCC1 family protein
MKNPLSFLLTVCILAAFSSAQILTQAETMSLVNYFQENCEFASGGKCIKVDKDSTGTATWMFTGPDGAYDMTVWYFDERDGQSSFVVYVNGAKVDSWKANRNTCSDVPERCNLKSRSLHGIALKNGCRIKLQGTYSAPGEYARYDCIYLNAAPIVSAPSAAPSQILAGGTTTLSVTAIDDGGEANLKYTWRKISGPGKVTFSRQGSNAAKTTVATIPAAGAYSFVVDVCDQGYSYAWPLSGTEPAKTSTSVPVVVTVSAVNTPPTVAKPASAASNPVIGTSTTVSVLGADDGGEANLTYTWDEASTPPQPVTFGSNGTNASKTTVVSFVKAGTYFLRATIKDAGNLSVTSAVTLVVRQTPATITVKPGYQRVLINTTQQFTAIADSDQFGKPVSPQPSFAWSVSGGGTMNSSGLFLARGSVGGPYTVTASSGPSSAKGTASLSVCNDSFDAFSRIPAASFSNMSGITVETCAEGGLDVTGISDQDYVSFFNVDFGSNGATIFCARVASGANGGSMQLRLDSASAPIAGSCTVPATGGWQTWTDALCNFSGASGKHTLFVTFAGAENNELFNLSSIHFTRISSVAAGDVATFFLTSDSTLWALGSNDYGQLGDGTTVDRDYPVRIMSGIKAMSSGVSHSLFLKTDGTLWACGDNTYGQLGDGTGDSHLAPVQVMSGVQSMRAGGDFSLMLKTDGTLWACGDNVVGELGDNSTVSRSTPEQIMSNVKCLPKGQSWHNLVVKNDSTLWTFGFNEAGQVGDGTTDDRYDPIQIMSGVQCVAAGWDHSLIVKTDGTLWACGLNASGELGDATDVDKLTPVQVMTGVKDVSAGNDYSIVLKADSTVWGFGANDAGQLGTGDTVDRFSPVQILSGVLSIDVGQCHSLMVKSDNTLWGCGVSCFGELGVPGTVNWLAPQLLPLDR